MNENAQKVIDACEAEFKAHQADCSGFARAVAARLGITLTGLANAIVDNIQGAGWTTLKDGVEAKLKADQGWLVIAGLKGSDQAHPEAHGHVVVVVSGPLAHKAQPTAYWGRLGGSGSKNKTINFAWRKADLANVRFAARVINP